MLLKIHAKRNATIALAGLWLALAGGCAKMTIAPTRASIPDSIPESITKLITREEPVVVPNQVAAVWTNAVLEKEGSRATRGFGGVLTFYAENRKRAGRVDGTVTVYAYDNVDGQENPTPTRKYVFKPEHLAKHYDGEQPAGPSYHVWIPWDEAGNPQRNIDLIVRFDPTEGKPVFGKSTHAVLPGPAATQERVWTRRTIEPSIRTCSAEAPCSGAPQQTKHFGGVAPPDPNAPPQPQRIQTTTFTVPPRGT
jgi:hypothetical protein